MNPSFAITLSAAGFGFLSLFSAIASKAGTSVETHLLIRFSIGALILGFIAHRNEAFRAKISTRDLLWIVASGAGCYTLESLSFFHGLRYVPSSVMALLLYTFPVPVTLISVLVFKERLNAQKIIAVLLAVIGAAFIASPRDMSYPAIGIALGIASSVIYAIYILLGTHRLSRINPWLASFGVSFSTALSYLVINGVNGFHWPSSPTGWLACIGSGTLSTALALSLLLVALPRVGAIRASTLSTIEPLMATLLGVLYLGEPFGLWQITGASCILAATLIATRTR